MQNSLKRSAKFKRHSIILRTLKECLTLDGNGHFAILDGVRGRGGAPPPPEPGRNGRHPGESFVLTVG